jgi:hypothetical protein
MAAIASPQAAAIGQEHSGIPSPWWVPEDKELHNGMQTFVDAQSSCQRNNPAAKEIMSNTEARKLVLQNAKNIGYKNGKDNKRKSTYKRHPHTRL